MAVLALVAAAAFPAAAAPAPSFIVSTGRQVPLARRRVPEKPTVFAFLKPEYTAYVHGLAQKAHFSVGFLIRRTKEMLAPHGSALNKCKH